MTTKTASTHKKWLPKHSKWVHFVHRDTMRRKAPMAKASLPKTEPPATTLPVDNTGNATVSCPMDGNDTLGICGPAMMAHMTNIRTYGQGKSGFTEKVVNLAALESQYESPQYSNGDNGTDEDMLVGVNGMATAAGGGLAGDPTDIVADHLDVDVTDVPLAQYCNDQFYGVHMAWSVPDDFLQNFAQGVVFAAADIADPANGHYTPLSDIGGPASVAADGTNVNGFYRLWTWGTWCWVSPAFVASVDPQSFITFSALQFNAQGYDSHGRHVSDQAAAWVAIGGNAALVAAVVSQFPAKPVPSPTPPGPTPPPVPTGPLTLAAAQAAVATAINAADALETRQQAIDAADAGLATLTGWATS
jgi:hypothetical protein